MPETLPTQRLARLFKALSEETRLEILALLFRHEELCVCEVEEVLRITQSKASRHLRFLEQHGLLQSRRAGAWVLYGLGRSLGPNRARVLALVEELLGGVQLAELDQRLERSRAATRTGCAPQRAARRPRDHA